MNHIILYDSDGLPILETMKEDNSLQQAISLAAKTNKKLVDWVLFGSKDNNLLSLSGVDISGLSVIDGSISDVDFTGCIYNAATSFDGTFFTNCKFEDDFLKTVSLYRCSAFYSKEESFIPSKQIKILKKKKVIIYDLDNAGYYGDAINEEEE